MNVRLSKLMVSSSVSRETHLYRADFWIRVTYWRVMPIRAAMPNTDFGSRPNSPYLCKICVWGRKSIQRLCIQVAHGPHLSLQSSLLSVTRGLRNWGMSGKQQSTHNISGDSRVLGKESMIQVWPATDYPFGSSWNYYPLAFIGIYTGK